MDIRRLLECFTKKFFDDDSYIDFIWEKNDSKITVHPKQYLEKFDHEFDYEENYSKGMSFSDWLILNQCEYNSLPWKK